MTMIYTAEHVDRLVGEIRHWDPKDKDLGRIAAVLPLAVIETAYVTKLDAMPAASLPEHAKTAAQKLAIMRRIFTAWLRTDDSLGDLLSNSFGGESDQRVAETLVFSHDAALVAIIEKMYSPTK